MGETAVGIAFRGKDLVSPVVRNIRGSLDKFKKDAATGFGIGAGISAFNLAKQGIGFVVDAIGDALDAAGKFEDQMATINTVARLQDEALGSLGDEIRDWAIQSGRSVEDLTGSFYDLVSAGIAVDDGMGVLKDATTLAIGGLATTGEVVDLLTSTLNSYGMEAKESTRLTDIFAQSIEEGKLKASDIAQSLSNVAPVAAQAGVEIEEVAAAYAVMTAQGVPAAEVTTFMRSAIVALMAPTRELTKLQTELGVSFEQVAREEGLAVALEQLADAADASGVPLKRLLGRVEAYQFAVQVTGRNQKTYNASLGRMVQAGKEGGVAIGQMAEKTDTLAFQQQRLDAAINDVNIRIGELLTGPAANFADWLADSLGGGDRATDRIRGFLAGIEGVQDARESLLGSFDALYPETRSIDLMGAGMSELEKAVFAADHAAREWAATVGGLQRELGLTNEEMIAMARLAITMRVPLQTLTLHLADQVMVLQDQQAMLRGIYGNWEGYTFRAKEAGEETSRFGRTLEFSKEELAALPGAMAFVSDGLKDIAKEAREARERLDELRKPGDGVRQGFAKLTREMKTWEREERRALRANDIERWNHAVRQQERIAEELADLGLVKKAYRDAKQEAKALRRASEDPIEVDIEVSGMAALRTAGDLLGAIKGGRSPRVIMPAPKFHDEIPGRSSREGSFGEEDGPGKAHGGPVHAGQTYLVGERGPELLRMGSQGGSITPNSALGGPTYMVLDGEVIGRLMDRRLGDRWSLSGAGAQYRSA